ncbi:MAG: alpha/beta hydrolase [Alphaproteobacteria bacterium]|nr:alpha/beta hydrolase [Alphaproteobacteria bacterium]
MTEQTSGVSRFITASDGLQLHYREYNEQADGRKTPMVCLPGLARTAMDFDRLARALIAGDAGKNRRIIAVDYRGRGLSDRDRNWRNYDMRVENADILSVLAAARIEHAVFLGTSRGGLHTMMLGAIRPSALRAVILNDIGPVIETKGLMRIRGYVGKLPQPSSWDNAVQLAQQIMSAQFTGLSLDDWRAYAELTFEEKDGKFIPRYDAALSKPLLEMNLENGVPALWPQFDGLRHLPVLAIRGANSDLLSNATLEAMAARHGDCQTHTVEGQGHAPLLLDEASIARVAKFVERF